MFEFQSTLFQGDQLLQAIADDTPTANGGLTRISRTQNARDPAVGKVQLALLDWHADVLPVHGADGGFGNESGAAVHRFKAEELGVPEAEIIEDVGPLTVQRLDAIRAAAEAPPDPPPLSEATVNVVNQYGEPLMGVAVSADDGSAVANATTDQGGLAFLAVNGPAQVSLDQSSILSALGDLLDRTASGADPGAATVITPSASAALAVGPGEQLDVFVAARVDVSVRLLAPVEGSPQITRPGARVMFEDDVVTLALQATGGEFTTVLLEPAPSGELPVELPSLGAFVPPNDYVVQDGDTESSLGSRFLDDPEAFAELSDHPPVVGETLTLPPEAVPGWVAIATEPLPDPMLPRDWLTVVPDEVLAALYEGADLAPVEALVAQLEAPPAAAEDPLAVGAARAASIAGFLALGPGAGVAGQAPVDSGVEGEGLDALQA